jgi:hypothetical protein
MCLPVYIHITEMLQLFNLFLIGLFYIFLFFFCIIYENEVELSLNQVLINTED